MKITRGAVQAFVLALFVLPGLGAYLLHPLPVYGPLVGSAIGCCAISIAIQQMYAYSTRQSPQAEHTVYLWSALTLMFLGVGTVTGCLPNMVQLELSTEAQRKFFALSTVLFVFGFLTFFRLAAAYLYRGRKDVLSEHLFRIFLQNARVDRTGKIEVFHFLVWLACLVTAVAAYIDEGGIELPPTISPVDPIYFPLSQTAKIALGVGLFITAACILWFFRSKFNRIKRGESLDGVEFTSVMGVLFLAPCLIQATALSPWITGKEHFVVIGWLVLFLGVAAVIVLNWRDDPEPSATVHQQESAGNTKRAKVALLLSTAICLIFCSMLLADRKLLTIIPFVFVTIGFLTLACAYLPIHDLEKLSASADAAKLRSPANQLQEEEKTDQFEPVFQSSEAKDEA